MALSAAEKQAAYRERSKGRDAAIAHGRALGTDEADRLEARGSDLVHREARIARAERYAVWVYEGKL